jgi:flagellar protein FlaI
MTDLAKSLKADRAKNESASATGRAAPSKPTRDSLKADKRRGKQNKKLRTSNQASADPAPAELHVTEIPALPPGHEELDRRIIRPGKTMVRISNNMHENRIQYEVIEPQLTAEQQEIQRFIRDTLVKTLDGRTGDEDWGEVLRAAVDEVVSDHGVEVEPTAMERIQYHTAREFLGFGPVDVMMGDPMLEDISCDGPGIPIYVFHRAHGSVRSNVSFPSDTALDAFVVRLAQRSGKHISIAEPLLDATLPEGSRLQATLGREVTSRGSSFTIRKFRAEPMTPPDLVAVGTLDTAMAAYFWFLMEEGRSLLYAGGTASGKTTSLNAVCQFIPPAKKIISIEDTRELNLLHENWIAGVTRSGFGTAGANGLQAGAIDMYRLLEAALRQRPEYLLVGEVRGKEALTLFQAMATGHAVFSTMHADSVQSAVYRLENPPINVPRMMLQTLDTVAIQAQVKTGDQHVRRIKEVVEITGFDPDTDDLLTNTVFHWDSETDRHMYTGHSEVLDQIADKQGWSDQQMATEWQRRSQLLDHMQREGIRDFKSVNKLITEYYQRPDALIKRLQLAGRAAPTPTPNPPAAASEARIGPETAIPADPTNLEGAP